MIAKKILVATLGLSTIALYSCGGKNNKTPAVAASEKSNKEEKKTIKVNFSTVTRDVTRDIAIASAYISVDCGYGSTSYTLSPDNQNISVLSGRECTLKISKFNDYTAAAASNPLTLTLNSNGDIVENTNATKFFNEGNTFYLNGKKVGDTFTIFVANEINLLKNALAQIDSVTRAPQPSSHNVLVRTVELVERTYSQVTLSGSYDVEREFGSLKHNIVRTNIILAGLPTTSASDCKIASGITDVDVNDPSFSNCNENSVNSANAYTMLIKQLDGSFKKHIIPAITVPVDLGLETVRPEKDLLKAYFDAVNAHLTIRIAGVNAKIATLRVAYDGAIDQTLTDSKDNIEAVITEIDDHVSGKNPLDKENLVALKTALEDNRTDNAGVTAYAEALIEKVKLLIEIEDKSMLYQNRDAAK